MVARAAFGAPTTENRIAYMRYVGQGHEIPVPLPARDADGEADVPAIRAAYDAEYTRFYDRPVPGQRRRDPELRRHGGDVVEPVEPVAAAADARRAPTPSAHQPVRDTTTGEVADWAVYDRAALAPGAQSRRPVHRRGGRDLHAGRPGLERYRDRLVHRTDAGGR